MCMSRKKNLLEYLFMALMIMCLGLALGSVGASDQNGKNQK